MLPSLIILDNFLKDPYAARAKALALDYDPALKKGNYPGTLSSRPLEITGLDGLTSKQIGVPVRPAPGTSHGFCRLTLKGDKGRTGVHIDPCFYSGILYLSLPEHCRGGTDFYRHRRTGLEAVPRQPTEWVKLGYKDPNALIEDVVNKDTFRSSAWERVHRVPMRFNRLILFDPWLFHDAGPGFGTCLENGRLIELMFFEKG
ncbi:MAG: DUF6445 family protein [Pseudomonadota bacterium]